MHNNFTISVNVRGGAASRLSLTSKGSSLAGGESLWD